MKGFQKWLCVLSILFGSLCTVKSQVMHPLPLRVAIAGVSHGHSSTVFDRKKTTDIEVVGIYEPDPVLAEVFRKQYNLEKDSFYNDRGKMLSEVKPQAVVAFNSTDEHLSVVEACALKGIHVMFEKPLATSADQVTKMEHLINANKIYILTNYETSWYPSIEKLIQLVNDSNYVGKIRKVVIRVGNDGLKKVEKYKYFFNWLTDSIKNGGGAIMDMGSYGANIMTFLMGNQKPISVSAVTRQFKQELYPNVDDEATIIINYPTVQCLIEASWNWLFSKKELEVYGDSGYLIAENDTTLHKRNLKMKSEEIKHISVRDMQIIDNPFSYLKGVINGNILMPANGLYSIGNNKLVLDILDAARLSAKSGKVIYLK